MTNLKQLKDFGCVMYPAIQFGAKRCRAADAILMHIERAAVRLWL